MTVGATKRNQTSLTEFAQLRLLIYCCTKIIAILALGLYIYFMGHDIFEGTMATSSKPPLELKLEPLSVGPIIASLYIFYILMFPSSASLRPLSLQEI